MTSDFHKLVKRVMKIHFQKTKPNLITYGSQKNSGSEKIIEDLKTAMETKSLL